MCYKISHIIIVCVGVHCVVLCRVCACAIVCVCVCVCTLMCIVRLHSDILTTIPRVATRKPTATYMYTVGRYTTNLTKLL